MVELLEMDRLKGSGSMEQRLASLEEQVGFTLGPAFLGSRCDGPGWSLCGLVALTKSPLGHNGEKEVGTSGHLFPMGRGAFFIFQKIPPEFPG